MSNKILYVESQKEKMLKFQQLLQQEELTEELRKEIDLIQIYRSLESNIFPTNILWRITPEGIAEHKKEIKIEDSNKEVALKLHLVRPVIYSLIQYGGHFDYELSERLNKPLFMIKHALSILSKQADNCPLYVTHKYKDYGCLRDYGYLSFDKPLVEDVWVEKGLNKDVLTALRYGCKVEKIEHEYEIELPTLEITFTKNSRLSQVELKDVKNSWERYKLSI